MTLCSFPWAGSCSRKHMLGLLRLKGRTAEILFIDAIGRCSALNVCPARAGIVSLPATSTYLITFCVHNALYILVSLSLPIWIQRVTSIQLRCPLSCSKTFTDLIKTARKSTTDCGKLNFNGGVHAAVCLVCFWTAGECRAVNSCPSLQYETFHQGLESHIWNIN